MCLIRKAEITDLPVITEIYNDAILTTTATFDIEPKSLETQEAWFYAHGPRYPLIVAEVQGEVVGWASLSRYSDRLAYEKTAEISVYVKDGFRGRGIGRKLMEEIIARGRAAGLHTILARITASNEQSIYLHEAFGFQHIGVMREVGRKFGMLLDVCLMQLIFPQS
ncbi:MAG TPA: N-acetyltransferase [Clostridia bacterium]|nr:N-acetyltransferase [Clostridia bacterium]